MLDIYFIDFEEGGSPDSAPFFPLLSFASSMGVGPVWGMTPKPMSRPTTNAVAVPRPALAFRTMSTSEAIKRIAPNVQPEA